MYLSIFPPPNGILASPKNLINFTACLLATIFNEIERHSSANKLWYKTYYFDKERINSFLIAFLQSCRFNCFSRVLQINKWIKIWLNNGFQRQPQVSAKLKFDKVFCILLN